MLIIGNFALLVWLAVLSGPTARDQSPSLIASETTLAAVTTGANLRTLQIDATGDHVLWVMKDGGARRIVLDGKAGPPYEQIDYAVVSPRGGRYAYAAKRNQAWFTIIDGREFGPYHRTAPLSFSPDATRVAFAIDNGDGDVRVRVDGIEHGPFHDNLRSLYITGGFVFSQDGAHFAFRTSITENGENRRCLVVDGKCGRRVTEAGPPYFSADGAHVAYWAKPRGEKGLLLIVDDEVVGRSSKDSTEWLFRLDQMLEDYGLPFAPDREHLLFVSTNNGGDLQVVVNGIADAPFDKLGGLAFSRDGTHWAYVGTREKRGSKWLLAPQIAGALMTGGYAAPFMPGRLYGHRIVRDRIEQVQYATPNDLYTMYEYTASSPVVVTDDGRVAYRTSGGLAIDGVEQPVSGSVSLSSITLAPDGRGLAYFVWRRNKWFAAVEGVEGQPHSGTIHGLFPCGRACGPSFTPDRRHVVYAVREKRGERIAVLGCGETAVYERLSIVRLRPPAQVVFAGVRGGAVYRVTVDAAGCPSALPSP